MSSQILQKIASYSNLRPLEFLRRWRSRKPDFILASPEGTPAEEEKWIVGEFNCSCVGISKCLAAYCKDDTPNACFTDIAAEDLAEAQRYGDLMGEKALALLGK